MNVAWSPRAISHLAQLLENTEKDSEHNASLVANRILMAVALLHSHPEIGRPGRVVGTRELASGNSGDFVQPAHYHVGCESHMIGFRAGTVAPAYAVTERLGPGGVPCVRGHEENFPGGYL